MKFSSIAVPVRVVFVYRTKDSLTSATSVGESTRVSERIDVKFLPPVVVLVLATFVKALPGPWFPFF